MSSERGVETKRSPEHNGQRDPVGGKTRLIDYALSVERDLVASIVGWQGDAFRRALADALSEVNEEHISNLRCREVFEAARWLLAEGTDPGPATLPIALRHLGKRERLDEDVEFFLGSPSPANAARLAREVRSLALQRQAAGAAQLYAQAAGEGNLQKMSDVLVALAPVVAELSALGSGDAPAAHGVAPLDWEAFWSEEPEPHQWLVDPVLPKGRQVEIYSPPKVGKSLLSLEIAAGLATGRPVLSTEAGEGQSVVYIDMEMSHDDLYERLEELGYGPEDDLSKLHYYQLQSFVMMDTEEGGALVEWVAKSHDAQAVVIDTMARVVEGDENDADTYRAFYRCTGRRLKALGCSLLRLDHAGKEIDKGPRGSSAKADDVDVVFRLASVDEGQYQLTCTHQRIAWVGDVLLRRVQNPYLRHEVVHGGYLAGTREVADLLDELGVSVGDSVRMAEKALRRANKGRRHSLVVSAMRFRAEERARQTRPHESTQDTTEGWFPEPPGTTFEGGSQSRAEEFETWDQ